jgi:hypothetical protein
MSEMAEKPSGRAERAANLFDLRRIIGALFVVWGVLLVILGLTESDAEVAKAADVNINLYAGLGMLVFGLLFLLWAFTRPLGEELREAETGEHQASPRAAAPQGVDAAALASEESRRRARGDSEGGRRPRDPGGQ